MGVASEIVLVTGGAGFIGSHVVDRLLAQGREVVVVDNFAAGKRENLAAHANSRHLRVIDADLCDDFAAALGGVRPAAVVHLGAQVSVPRSVEDPIADLDLNLRASVRLLQWAAGAGARRVVLASSAAVYGEPARVPVSEDMCDRPASPYGASKRAAELFFACLGPALGVETAALRPFNVYGPRQDPRSAYSGVVSQFLARATAGEPLVVLGDGAQTRDFVYVEDVARAFVAAIDAPGIDGLVANLGSGHSHTIAALAAEIVAVTGSTSPVVFGAARAGDVAHSLADCGRAADRLGWRAEVPLA
ncbi:MAG TPA: NAD-dependent epimerase/dehydratase family protein, partial [Nannocystis sp.]